MKMSNKVYDVLKYIAIIGIPALVTLVLGITEIWGLPYGAEIGATISAVGVFLGALLGISSSAHRKSGK